MTFVTLVVMGVAVESSELGDAHEKQQYINIEDVEDTEYVERCVPTWLADSIHDMITDFLKKHGYVDY